VIKEKKLDALEDELKHKTRYCKALKNKNAFNNAVNKKIS